MSDERVCRYLPEFRFWYENKSGEEVETELAHEENPGYDCDVCGYAMLPEWFEEEETVPGGWYYTPRFNYCPNCGAKVVD